MNLKLRHAGMTYLLRMLCLIMISSLLMMCSSRQNLIEGKWSLAGSLVGGTPSSFWFKNDGTVVANWKEQQSAFRSGGRYKFIDDIHIRITMIDGYYEGEIYNFEIKKK